MQDPFIGSMIGWELLFFVVMNALWISLYIGARRRQAKPVIPAKEPKVSVVIPVYNKAAYAAATIRSALNLDYRNKEIIVVNDGSTDGSLVACKPFAAKGLIKLINLKKNSGKSNALNMGIKAARGDFIFTMDSDSEVRADALNRLVGYFDDEEVGAVAGVVRVKTESSLLERFQFLEYFQQAFQRVIQGFFKSVMVLPGPISLFRKDAIASVGGFDNSTIVEDWDITMKLHKKRYRIVSDPRAFADTIPPLKLKEWWRQRTRWGRGGVQIATNHLDIFKKSNNKALIGLMFPLHIMWLFVPFIVIPTMIVAMMPSSIALTNLATDFSMLFSSFSAWLASLLSGAQFDITMIYKIFDQIVFDFIDPKSFNFTRAMGYLSGIAFLAFSYISLKTFKRDFRPQNLITILLMPIYWMLLNAVYVYAVVCEVAKRKLVW